MADEATPETQDGGEEKKTNRVFTQSEFDKALAMKEKEASEKFKDYETLKQKADSFEKWQAEQEASKLSEVEKANKKVSELETMLKQLESEKNHLSKQTMKLSVLSDPKFQILPDPYKKLIDGESEDDIKANAEKSLEEFQNFLKTLNKPQTSGLPPDIKQPIPAKAEDPIIMALKKRQGII